MMEYSSSTYIAQALHLLHDGILYYQKEKLWPGPGYESGLPALQWSDTLIH